MGDMTTWGGRRASNLRRLVAATYGLRCHLCGQQIASYAEMEADHVVPRSQGGSDALDNLRPAHGHCNQRRGTQPITTNTDRRHRYGLTP